MKHNPIDIIKKDHRKVEDLFKKYEGLGDSALVTKREVVDQIIEELTNHSEMEETHCYPHFMEVFSEEDDEMVEEAYAEHDAAKKVLYTLETLEPDQPEFDANVKVLMEQIRHHVKEEEDNILPAAEKEVPEEELEEMGNEMAEFKKARSAVA